MQHRDKIIFEKVISEIDVALEMMQGVSKPMFL